MRPGHRKEIAVRRFREGECYLLDQEEGRETGSAELHGEDGRDGA